MKDQLTPLRSTGIYIVEVPKESIHHGIHGSDQMFYYSMPGKMSPNFMVHPSFKGDWQILGTITSDSISFDPAPYLDFVWHKRNKLYLDYGKDPREWLNSPTASFRSLLNSCGYYWVNPYTNIPDDIDRISNLDWCNRWQSFEDNLINGILLSLIKK